MLGKLRNVGSLIGVSLMGAITLTAFFLGSEGFLGRYSRFSLGDVSFAIVVAGFFTGFFLGALLREQEMSTALYAGILTVFATAALSMFIVYWPLISGSVPSPELLGDSVNRQAVVLGLIVMGPIVIIAAAVGRGVSENSFPSEEELATRRQLKQQTEEWHRTLEERESGARKGT